MADARVEKGCDFSHVVVWDVDKEEMKVLDTIEATYNRVQCKVRLYDDSVITAWIYSQPKETDWKKCDAKEVHPGVPMER